MKNLSLLFLYELAGTRFIFEDASRSLLRWKENPVMDKEVSLVYLFGSNPIYAIYGGKRGEFAKVAWIPRQGRQDPSRPVQE